MFAVKTIVIVLALSSFLSAGDILVRLDHSSYYVRMDARREMVLAFMAGREAPEVSTSNARHLIESARLEAIDSMLSRYVVLGRIPAGSLGAIVKTWDDAIERAKYRRDDLVEIMRVDRLLLKCLGQPMGRWPVMVRESRERKEFAHPIAEALILAACGWKDEEGFLPVPSNTVTVYLANAYRNLFKKVRAEKNQPHVD